ncbi:MAG: MotA/TolQ/ExbB proton channel family protein [Dysgonamonadaceae bacterium]|nr:MotA/TolQ/ExbB proton channel family protein [Dysgonamonadaceae bacterium]
MKKILVLSLLILLTVSICPLSGGAQEPGVAIGNAANEETIHQAIKVKFIEGSAFFMSFIALALIAGLAFCLERIIYLNLSQINTRKLLRTVENKLDQNDLEGAKEITRSHRGPVASICYQALARIEEEIDTVERSIVSCGSVQAGLLEKNLSWITLFIAIAPSLGFLGTVVGMIKSFDDIQLYGDIHPAIVAGGMKLALITTVGGLIVALILQFFYNYILTKIEGIIHQMEDDSITILDLVIRYKRTAAKK